MLRLVVSFPKLDLKIKNQENLCNIHLEDFAFS